MNISWIIPVVVTVGSLAWAIPMRAEEKPNGSIFVGMNYVFGAGIRIAKALILSLICWLIWALVA